jgi:hypothetical protein
MHNQLPLPGIPTPHRQGAGLALRLTNCQQRSTAVTTIIFTVTLALERSPPSPPASPTCWFSSSCGSGILLPLLPAAAPPAAAGVRSGAAPSSSGPAALMQEPSSVATVREGSGALVKSRVDAWGWGKFVCEEGE